MSLTKIVNGERVELTEQEELELREQWRLADEEKESTQWEWDRVQAYGPIPEQLDFIVHNGIEAYIARNMAIKQQYPKPVEEGGNE